MTAPTSRAGVTVTDEVVEAAAKAMYEANTAFHDELHRRRGLPDAEMPYRPPWSETTEYHRDLYRRRTTAAVPHLLAGVSTGIAEAIDRRIENESTLMHVVDWVDGMETAANIALAYGKDQS